LPEILSMHLLKSFHNYILLFILFTFCAGAYAQELNCNVVVNGNATSITDQSVFRDMENSFEQFLNNRQWTDDSYQNFERIKCNILITLDQKSTLGNYEAQVQVQSARPVYNTTYESILLNFADRDWVFDYVQGQPLEFNNNSFFSNITSMLAFYAYVSIGMDYDSFGELGGTPHFENARNVVNNAQQSNSPGWNPLNSTRNRYWLIENLNNQQMQDIRIAWYNYHRKGLDTFSQNADESRNEALKLITAMQKTHRAYPNSILVIALLDAKSNEFINLFEKGDLNVRRKAYELLINMDPTKKQKYDQLIN
jgi:hypothetical protein